MSPAAPVSAARGMATASPRQNVRPPITSLPGTMPTSDRPVMVNISRVRVVACRPNRVTVTVPESSTSEPRLVDTTGLPAMCLQTTPHFAWPRLTRSELDSLTAKVEEVVETGKKCLAQYTLDIRQAPLDGVEASEQKRLAVRPYGAECHFHPIHPVDGDGAGRREQRGPEGWLQPDGLRKPGIEMVQSGSGIEEELVGPMVVQVDAAHHRAAVDDPDLHGSASRAWGEHCGQRRAYRYGADTKFQLRCNMVTNPLLRCKGLSRHNWKR